MSHVVEATYENGILKLDQPLPLKSQEKVRVTFERMMDRRHSIMAIPTVHVGKVLRPWTDDHDLLEESLEQRP